MFEGNILIFAIAGLVTLSVGAIVYTVFFAQISGTARAAKRVGQIKTEPRRNTNERRVQQDTMQRRKNIQHSIKELEEAQKKKRKKGGSPSLNLRIQQAGLTWSKRKYFIICIGAAFATMILSFLMGAKPLIAIGIGFVGGVGLPFWIVNFLRKRRQKKFLDELPTAVDVIVRGVKSGLPINDCLQIIAREAAEPVRTEFRKIIEAQSMGQPLSDAVGKLFERMPVAEANFFGIVIGIQQAAGGNLSEALGNLSKVLRDRKKMAGKIKAMSSEAKASAGIIGSLPIIVMVLVYVTTPTYIAMLFTTDTGNIILGASGLWMFIGIMVMKKMINFDF